jgi:hypothetical protein
MTEEDEFWAKVDRSAGPGECWPWLGRKDANGYGLLEWHGKTVRAHRVALALDGRPVGPGQVGRHLCNNPICCNPVDLAPGTRADDVQDMVRSGRARGKRLLSLEQARQCREWYRRGLATSSELGALFGISAARVRHIGTDEPYKELR